jgi:hypothetical protein
MGKGRAKKVETSISFHETARERLRTPDDQKTGEERARAAREAAKKREAEQRAKRSADAEAARAAKLRANMAKAKAAAVVVEDHAAIARQRRIEASQRAGTPKTERRPKQRKKVRLKMATQEERVAKIKVEIDAAEAVAKDCYANFIRHQYRMYRRRRERMVLASARLVQRVWRGGRMRSMLKETLAARTLQAAWRVYAARLGAVRGDLILVSVVRLQRAYFRQKRRRCELLYQLAVEAKEAAFVRRARIQAGAAAARRREDAARALHLAEEKARLQERVKAARVRRHKVMKRRRVVREAVRLIKAHREEKERRRLRALAVERMERILRKHIRMKMLRRLAARSFVTERFGRVNKELAACTRTIQTALRAAEAETEAAAAAGKSRRSADGSSRASSTPGHRAATAGSVGGGGSAGAVLEDAQSDTWDWGEGDDIIRSLHLRTALSGLSPSAAPAGGGGGGDLMTQRRALAETLEGLSTPRQKAVVAMVAATHPSCCVNVGPPGGPEQLTVDLGQIDEHMLREVRAAIGAESAASVWRRGGEAIPRAATAASAAASRRNVKLARLTRREKEKKVRREVSDGAMELRRTLRREFNSLGGTDAHARGMGFPSGGGGGGGGGGAAGDRRSKSRGRGSSSSSSSSSSSRSRTVATAPAATASTSSPQAFGSSPSARPATVAAGGTAVIQQQQQQQDRSSPRLQAMRNFELDQRQEEMRLQSPYNRRLSPLAKRHRDQMAATESVVHDDSEWVVRQLQHQAPIILGLASSQSPPLSRDVDRRAMQLGMPPSGTLLSYGEEKESPPEYRERRRQRKVDESLIGRIRLSHAMQDEMARLVMDEESVK